MATTLDRRASRRAVLRMPPLHAGQQAVADSRARFRVLACGRRWGKSTLALLLGLEQAAATPGAAVWYVAPTYPMADLQWRLLQSLLPPGLAEVRLQERRCVLPHGGEIAFHSADRPDRLRGAGLDMLIVDEAAFIRDGSRVWSEVLRPTLADREGRALLISTPNGRDWFHRLWLRGQGADADWESWRYPTITSPYIRAGEIEAARAEVPERVFRQEFEAEFIEGSGAVFRRVREAVDPSLPRAPYGGRFVIGVDWGKRHDFTVFCVIDVETGSLVAIERMNQIDYALQTERLNALCSAWRPELVQVEQNSIGEPLLEQLQRDGLPVVGFQTTAASKPRLIDALSVALERGELALPEDAVLLGELESYTVTPRAGGWSYGAPEGMHDDCVMALAIAWEARVHGARSAVIGWL